MGGAVCNGSSGDEVPAELCSVEDSLSSLPITEKHLGDGLDPEKDLAWGFGAMQGWRDAMEDAHLALPSLGSAAPAGASGKADPAEVPAEAPAEAPAAEARTWDDTALFGVMDGHGGAQVARFCERYLPSQIAAHPAEDPEGALVRAFEGMDDLLRESGNSQELRSLADHPAGYGHFHAAINRMLGHPFYIGCTAVVCCVRPDKLIVANAGDSRAVLCRGGAAVDLSKDHKPDEPEERLRILRAGGWVEEEDCGQIHRVNGDLSLSRAIGDLEYKQRSDLPAAEQIISATPDVTVFARRHDDEFVVIACDGIWDVVSSQKAVSFVRERLGAISSRRERLESGSLKLSSIAGELMDSCLSPDLGATCGLGGDNMTVVIVALLPEPGPPAPACHGLSSQACVSRPGLAPQASWTSTPRSGAAPNLVGRPYVVAAASQTTTQARLMAFDGQVAVGDSLPGVLLV